MLRRMQLTALPVPSLTVRPRRQTPLQYREPVSAHVTWELEHDVIEGAIGAAATHGDVELEEGGGSDVVVPGLG